MMNPERVIAAAQRLMTDGDFWNRVDEADRRNASSNGGRANQGSTESKAYNSGKQYNLITEEQIREAQAARYGDSYTERGSNLPEALRESFKNLPPIQFDDSVMAQIPDSFFAGASVNMQKEIQREQAQQRPQQRQVQQRNQINEYAQPQQVNTGIDYNYIKFLIQESVKEALKGVQLNESTNNSMIGMKIVNGGTFQFMDSKGHLYEAKLKRIK